MATILKTKNSVTAASAPSSLAQGELAVNITDKKVWVGNASSTPVQIVGSGATNAAGGSNTQVQYNSSGSLAGSANMTFSGTALTLANDASISGLTVGKGGSAVSGNVIVNTSALASNTTGSNLVAVGDRALNANTTGNGNSAFGYLSLYANTTGSNNTGYGGTSLIGNTTGSYNTAVGYDSLRSNTTASNNTAVGYQAGYSNTTSPENVAVGAQALYSNTTAGGNTAVGYRSLYTNNAGYQNSALGDQALYLNTSGVANASLGVYSLYSNTSGGSNTGLGHSALYSNTTASNNTAVGYQAGYSNSTGTYSTLIGTQAGYSQTTGYGTHLGWQAGYFATTGQFNTFLGIQSGYYVTTGAKNTILGCYNGNQGGLDIRTASNYIVLSDGDGNPRAYWNGAALTQNGHLFVTQAVSSSAGVGEFFSNAAGDVGYPAVRLYKYDNNSTTSQVLMQFVINNGGTGQGQINGNGAGAAAFGSFSDERLKENIVDLPPQLNNIVSLRPVEFDYKDGSGHQTGFIAQNMQKVYPDAVSENADGMLMLTGWSKTEAYLVKAIQELKAEVDSLKQQLG
jgi:hypothetical protein